MKLKLKTGDGFPTPDSLNQLALEGLYLHSVVWTEDAYTIYLKKQRAPTTYTPVFSVVSLSEPPTEEDLEKWAEQQLAVTFISLTRAGSFAVVLMEKKPLPPEPNESRIERLTRQATALMESE